jgi:glycerol-3-phosphate dehydrogenase subunit C
MPVTDLFPGPKYCGPQAQRFRSGDAIEEWVDYCSGCGACTRACPSGVKVAELNARARARVYEQRGRIPLRNRLLSRSEVMGKVGTRLAPLANFAVTNRLGRIVAERVLGIHRDAPVPRFSRGRFRDRFARLPQPENPRMTVGYFHGCSTNYYEPWVGEAAVRVLARHGVAVTLPPQNCCGLPFISNGDFTTARRYAGRNIAAMAPLAAAGGKIVATSTSCSFTLKSEYRDVLGIRTPEAEQLAAATYDIFEFLQEEVGWEAAVPAGDAARPRRVMYHSPCQLRTHGIGEPAFDALEQLGGVDLRATDVECCGIAGTYGLKVEKYQIACDVGAPIIERVREHGSELVACDSETCRWQITHLTGLPAKHPIELLDEAHGSA